MASIKAFKGYAVIIGGLDGMRLFGPYNSQDEAADALDCAVPWPTLGIIIELTLWKDLPTPGYVVICAGNGGFAHGCYRTLDEALEQCGLPAEYSLAGALFLESPSALESICVVSQGEMDVEEA